MKLRIISNIQNKRIKFNYAMLANILGINNEGSKVFKIKIIPTIEGFGNDKVIILHVGRLDFVPRAKI